MRNVFIVAATEPVGPLHVAFRRILAWSVWVGVIWIAGGLLDHEARVLVWCAALLLDYAGPFAGYRTPGLGRTKVTDWEIEHAHFAERFQTFVIIALGESIVTTGATAAPLTLSPSRGLAIAVTFALAAVLWWLYFDEVARRSALDLAAAKDSRGSLGRDAYTYLHLPIIAGIIVAAVGAEIVIAHPDHQLGASQLVVLAAGPILYLLGHVAFRLRMIGTLANKRLTAALLIALAAPAGSGRPALASATVVVAILAVLAAVETRGRLRQRGASRPTPTEQDPVDDAASKTRSRN